MKAPAVCLCWLLLAPLAQAQTLPVWTEPLPPIEVRQSFWVYLLKPRLGGDRYFVGNERFTTPNHLEPYIRTSGDRFAIAEYEAFRKDRHHGLVLEGVGIAALATGTLVVLGGILNGFGVSPNGQVRNSGATTITGLVLVLGSPILPIVAKKYHRNAYFLLHGSIDRYNATTRPVYLNVAPGLSPAGAVGGQVLVSF